MLALKPYRKNTPASAPGMALALPALPERETMVKSSRKQTKIEVKSRKRLISQMPCPAMPPTARTARPASESMVRTAKLQHFFNPAPHPANF